MDIRNIKISVGTMLTFASVGSLVVYGLSLHSLAKNAQIQVGARVHSIDWSSVQIAIEGRIINPTSGTVQVRQPLISLYGSETARKKNTPFSTSENSNETFTIPPNETKELKTILLSIPTGAILQLIAQGYLNGGQLSLVINVRTKIMARYFLSVPVSFDITQKIVVPKNFSQEALANPLLTKAVANKHVTIN